MTRFQGFPEFLQNLSVSEVEFLDFREIQVALDGSFTESVEKRDIIDAQK